MKKSVAAWLVVAATICASPALAEVVRIHGSTTVSKNLVEPNKAKIEQASGQTVEIKGNGSSQGIIDLVNGNADIAMISADIGKIVSNINAKAPNSVDAASLVTHSVGMTEVVFVIHPSNGLSAISPDQLIRLLTGKATSWADVGGADVPVVIMTEMKGGGIRSIVESDVLSKGDITGAMQEFKDAPDVITATAGTPGALGLASSVTVNGSVKVIYPGMNLAQPLTLVTQGKPTGAIKSVVDSVRSLSK